MPGMIPSSQVEGHRRRLLQGCGGVRPLASVWEGLCNGMHQFKGIFSGTKRFLELLDSVMGEFTAGRPISSRSVEIFNDEIASVLTGRAS